MSVLEKVKKVCDEGGGLRSRESGRDRALRGGRFSKMSKNANRSLFI